jgi:ribosomal protein S11
MLWYDCCMYSIRHCAALHDDYALHATAAVQLVPHARRSAVRRAHASMYISAARANTCYTICDVCITHTNSVAGNTFVLKPSERDPGAAMLLAKLAQQAGLPYGVLNVIHGGKAAVRQNSTI